MIADITTIQHESWVSVALSAMTLLSVLVSSIAYYIRAKADRLLAMQRHDSDRALAEQTHDAVNSGLTAVRDDNKVLNERIVSLEKQILKLKQKERES